MNGTTSRTRQYHKEIFLAGISNRDNHRTPKTHDATVTVGSRLIYAAARGSNNVPLISGVGAILIMLLPLMYGTNENIA